MDQIVAQALTTYGKIVGMKHKEAALKQYKTAKQNGHAKTFVSAAVAK